MQNFYVFLIYICSSNPFPMKNTYIFLLLTIVVTSSTFAQINKSESKQNNFLKQLKTKKQAPTAQAKAALYKLPGQSLNYYWGSFSSTWNFNDTSKYYYNVNGLISKLISSSLSGVNQTLYTYDTKERETQQLSQYWDSFTNQWVNSSRITTTYDANDNQVIFTYESYNSGTNTWSVLYGNKHVYTYSSNRITVDINQSWDSNNLIWKDSDKIIYTYNSNGQITQIENQTINNNSWVNNSRESYLYDIFGKIIEAELEVWGGTSYVKSDKYTNVTWHNWTGNIETSTVLSYTAQQWNTPIANQWNLSGRSSSVYGNFGGHVTTEQTYTNSVFVNDYRYSEFYDSKYNEIGYLDETWNTTTSQWETDGGDNIIHTYDTNDQILETIWQYWQISSSSFVNSERKVYSDYQTITGINKNELDASSISTVFPNPCEGECVLRLDSNSDLKNATLHVYDITGKTVFSSEISSNVTNLNLKRLNSGIYFYSILNNNSIINKGKIIIN